MSGRVIGVQIIKAARGKQSTPKQIHTERERKQEKQKHEGDLQITNVMFCHDKLTYIFMNIFHCTA